MQQEERRELRVALRSQLRGGVVHVDGHPSRCTRLHEPQPSEAEGNQTGAQSTGTLLDNCKDLLVSWTNKATVLKIKLNLGELTNNATCVKFG